MKIERVLRKAAPFLLITILIACLFIQPQKEGMKAFTEVDQLSHNTNQYTEHIKEQPKAYSHNIGKNSLVPIRTAQKVGYRLYDQEEVEDVGIDFHDSLDDHDLDPDAMSFDRVDTIDELHGWTGDED